MTLCELTRHEFSRKHSWELQPEGFSSATKVNLNYGGYPCPTCALERSQGWHVRSPNARIHILELFVEHVLRGEFYKTSCNAASTHLRKDKWLHELRFSVPEWPEISFCVTRPVPKKT